MDSISVRIEHKGKDKATFQNRHDLRNGHVPKYVSQDKSHLNSVLISPVPYGVLKQTCDTRRALRPTQKKMKSTAAVATVGIITFSTDAQKIINALPSAEQDIIFKEVSSAIAERLDNEITGLTVHRDESAIHGHFQMPAYSKSGIPTSKIVNPKIASELQDIAGAVVMKYGISRGIKKAERILNGEDVKTHIHRSVQQLHEDLPLEIETLELELAEAKAKILKQQNLITNQHLKLDALALEVSTAEAKMLQAEKTLAVYEKRETDTKNLIKKMDDRIIVLKGMNKTATVKELKYVTKEGFMSAEYETGRFVAEAEHDRIVDHLTTKLSISRTESEQYRVIAEPIIESMKVQKESDFEKMYEAQKLEERTRNAQRYAYEEKEKPVQKDNNRPAPKP